MGTTALGREFRSAQSPHPSAVSERRDLSDVLNDWRTETGVGVGLVLLCALWIALAPNFATATNLSLMLAQASVLMVVAVGQTFVILTGEIDLSVGSTIGLTTIIVAALTVKASVAWPLAVLAAVAVGALIGMATGLLRVIWGIPSFIVTLGLLTALQGIAFTISNGVTIAPTPPQLSPLWAGSLIGIATPIWVMIVVVGLGLWTLSSTRYGRRIYAIGGNLEAARRYGVRSSMIKVSVFVIVQLCAVLGGLLYTAQLGSGNATVGRFFELNVIASVVVGGVALFGGQGRLVGTALGVLFISVLANGLTLVGVSSYLFLIAQGLVVIAAVWFAAVQQRRAALRRSR
jgi:ribose/xylose/arabinose/galactoside ABC-type transport system permease subunit